MKAYYGDAATAENNFAYDWLPKRDGAYDILRHLRAHAPGQDQRLHLPGLQPAGRGANKKKLSPALAKLKYLVVMDPLETETSEFWKNFGPFNDVEPAEIQTEVFRFRRPASPRRRHLHQLQPRDDWKEKAVDPPGEAKPRPEIMARLFIEAARPVREGRRHVARADRCTHLALPQCQRPRRPRNCAKEMHAAWPMRRRRPIPKPDRDQGRWSRPASSCRASRCCATTAPPACGNWIYSGCWTQAGNLMARRDTADPTGLGVFPGWGFSWPANRRILYNRASADTDGKPWDPSAQVPGTGTARRWAGGADVPDMRPDAAPEQNVGAVHHEPGRRGAAVHAGRHGRRPVPRALRAVRDRRSA